MDRRTVIAVVLSLGIYYAWLMWRGPQKPTDPVNGEVTAADPASPEPTAPPAPRTGLPPVSADAERVPATFCAGTVSVNTDGGGLTNLVLPDVAGPYHVTAIYQWVFDYVTGAHRGAWLPYGPDPGPAHVLTERARALDVGTGSGPAASDPLRMAVVSRSERAVTVEGTTADGVLVRQAFSERPGDTCTIDVQTTFSNPGAAPVSTSVWWSVVDHTTAEGGRGTSQHQPTALVDGSLYYGGALGAGCIRAGTKLSDTSGPIPLPGPVSWFGISDRYFGFFVVPEREDFGEVRFERLGTGVDSLDGEVLHAPVTLAPQASLAWRATVYAGENHLSALAAVHPTLERVVDLGWFAMFGYPLLWVLRLFHAGLGDWGLSIIGVTVLVKVVFFPLTHKAMKSTQAMAEIQPALAKLKEQFADDPTELNRRTLQLMQDHQVNPVTGCLPMLLQTPVFIALYNVLLTNVEFYQEKFLYLRDLSSPDPYCILPLLVTALMWGQQQLTAAPQNMDPAQQAVLKWMPLMFGLFFFTSPSGLGVYFFVNMSLSILQQWLIKRSLGTGSKVPPVVGVNP